ncbi:alpha-rhamnosidase [Filimonas effusa]|uniref:alpha-L-rhamnosidase n=2 Tax=Filimonas effusa TaxID=2508721 RepID=A0A4V1MAY1_9BACT|nr:alpha-rhamnosidase [Filimonas effusa]
MKRFLASILFLLPLLTVKAQINLRNLRCEMLVNPLSVTAENPRLSWEIVGKERGLKQEAYEILVASDPAKLAAGEGDLWNSGKVETDNSVYIAYQGKRLASNKACYWKVRVYTNKGLTEWSGPAQWGTGLRYYKDWEGRWIGFDRLFPWENAAASRLSARYFRKEFAVAKQVKSATAYIMGLGLYELSIDGKKVGDQVLAPAPTDYTKNIKYNTFDVTEQLKQGQHAIGVVLGNGRFYAMRQTKAYKNNSFGYPKLMFQLIITYTDGSRAVIKTDDSWKGTADGPIRTNNEYDGEEYDAQKEMKGWDKAGFDDKSWLKAEFVQEPGGRYEAQMNENMKVMKDLTPVAIIKKGGDRYIVDLGQNMAGWVKLQVKGKKGQKVTLRFAESLQDNGEIFTTNLRDAKATDIYTLKGEGMESWEPRFTYHGFRYIEVSGYPGTLSKNDITGRLVYDDIATVSTFESSNAVLNQIYKNSWWAIASNYKGMPIDCPQRNERQPWLGDRAMVAYSESFLFDNARLYTKWLDDIKYAQKPDGAIPDVAPAFWRYYSDNMTWPGTYLMVAEMLYNQTGDVALLKDHYPSMKKWLQYMKDRYMTEDGIVTKDSYGDWCVPPVTAEAGKGVNADQKHPSQLISTAYYYHFMQVMMRFCKITGNEQDSTQFAQLAEKVKQGFNSKFYHEEGYYGDNTLTDNLLPVCFKMIDPANKNKVWKNLAYIVEVTNKGHLSTGVVGTQWLMYGLTEIGKAELAYGMATQKTYPSLGYMIENGATSIWELWNGNTAAPKMNSQNHVMMLGDLFIWYFEHLAAIRADARETGFKKVIMKPKRMGDLSAVNATYRSNYGEVKSDWKQVGASFFWNITVPPNTTAVVYLPVAPGEKVYEAGKLVTGKEEGILSTKPITGRLVLNVGSGNYSFEVKK